MVSPELPMPLDEWRGYLPIYESDREFLQEDDCPFTIGNLRRAPRLGDGVIKECGGLNSALRAIQEVEMQEQE